MTDEWSNKSLSEKSVHSKCCDKLSGLRHEMILNNIIENIIWYWYNIISWSSSVHDLAGFIGSNDRDTLPHSSFPPVDELRVLPSKHLIHTASNVLHLNFTKTSLACSHFGEFLGDFFLSFALLIMLLPTGLASLGKRSTLDQVLSPREETSQDHHLGILAFKTIVAAIMARYGKKRLSPTHTASNL